METAPELTVKQEKLIALLLTERSVDRACKKAGVNVSTYWRWIREENFLAEYRRLRRLLLEDTVARLRSITCEAVETLERNLRSGNPHVEIRAARIILELTLKGAKALDTDTSPEPISVRVRYATE